MKVTIYYYDEDNNYQKLEVQETEALAKVRELLDSGNVRLYGISFPYAG